MRHRLIIPLNELCLPAGCIVCAQPAFKVFRLEVKRNLDLLIVRREQWIDIPVALCTDCHRNRRRTTILAHLAFWLVFVALAFGGLVLAVDYDSPLAGWAMGALFAMALFGRLGMSELIVWFTVGMHGVLLRGEPLRARIAVRSAPVFHRLASVNTRAIAS